MSYPDTTTLAIATEIDTSPAPPVRQYDAFRRHLEICPACASEHNDMCAVGYRLLRKAME